MDRLSSMRLGQIRPQGWIRQQMLRDLEEGFAGHLDALSGNVACDLFRERIECSPRQHAWWDAESRGNWLWGYVMMAFLARHPAHMARAASLVEALAGTQDADGYIGIYSPQSRFRHAGENAELWAQSRALMAMLACHEFTGDASLLARASAAADLTARQYGPGRSYFHRPATAEELTGMTHGLCYVDVAATLHRLTGEERYRAFGRWLYRDFSAVPRPFQNDDFAASNLGDPQLPLSGHAAHTVEHLRAVLLEGSRELTEAALAKLRRLTTPSGAVVGDEWIHGLPLASAGYEYCTLTELLFSLTHVIEETGEAALGDWVECLAFNAAQGARAVDGRAVSYLTSDTRLYASADRPDSHSLFAGGHGRFKMSPTHGDVACCCNPNAVRLMPHFVQAMWMRTADGLAAMLYGPCTLETRVGDTAVVIEEATAYPFDDQITFEIAPERPVHFALVLRRPGWASAMLIEGADAVERNGSVVVERLWSRGDRLTVRFETAPRLVAYPTGEAAVFHGPLQYVQPIAATERVLKEYAVEGFRDCELAPSDVADLARIPVLSSDGTGLAWSRDDDIDPRMIWSKPGVHVTAGGVVLVPMGSAPLRRAAFPVVERR